METEQKASAADERTLSLYTVCSSSRDGCKKRCSVTACIAFISARKSESNIRDYSDTNRLENVALIPGIRFDFVAF